MPEERRKQLRPPEINAVQQDFERSITDLGGGKTPEELMTKKRIVKTPDSETTVEYELKVDQRAGQQYVEERWSTTKQECAVCGRYTGQIKECWYCELKICDQCIRFYDYHQVCKSCFDSRIQQEKT